MVKRGSAEWKQKVSNGRKGKRGGIFPGDANPSKRLEVRQKISDILKNLWKQEPYRTRWLNSLERFNSTVPLEHYQMMGKRSRLHENEVAAKLTGLVFQPNEVCDRIIIRDGQVFFIEIKRHGQKLTEKQGLFQSIVKDRFQILYS
jgi:hypothetical protein